MTIGKNSINHIMDPEKKNKAIFCNGNRAILVSLLYAVENPDFLCHDFMKLWK